jgi:hypothetical protein
MSYIPSVWIWLAIIACITLSALFAGLNLAIFSLSQLRLQLEADGGNKDATRVLDLRRNSNQVLARPRPGCWSLDSRLAVINDTRSCFDQATSLNGNFWSIGPDCKRGNGIPPSRHFCQGCTPFVCQ